MMRYFHEYLNDVHVPDLESAVRRIVQWEPPSSGLDTVEALPDAVGTLSVASLRSADISLGASQALHGAILRGSAALGLAVAGFTVDCMRYDTGIGLFIHNDFEPDNVSAPSARLVFQFRNTVLVGGELEFYERVGEEHFEPLLTCLNDANHLAGFVISEDSFHAVQPISSGIRMSCVVNLYEDLSRVDTLTRERLWLIV